MTSRERGLLDTSVFIARESGRPMRSSALPDEVAVSVVVIGELRAGVLSAPDVEARDVRLATLTHALTMEPVSIDLRISEQWATLRVTLRDAGRSMPINDSWIAATAMSLGVAVVSQDSDYDGIPGLEVVRL